MRESFEVKLMTLNCASFKARWALRVLVLAARILLHRPDVLTCVELYAPRRPRLTALIARQYVCVGSYKGKVIYLHKHRHLDWHRGSLLRVSLGHGKHALAVRMFDRASGQWVVIVVAHLSWQIRYDARRDLETRRLDNKITARFLGVPVIYSGDWNSSRRKGKRKRDAVGDVFTARGLTEAYTAAKTRAHKGWNSANRFKRPGPADGIHLDRMFGRGVEFLTWALDYYTGRYGSDHFAIVITARIPITKGTP